MRKEAAAVKKSDEITSSVGVTPPGSPGQLEPRRVVVDGAVNTMSKGTDFNMQPSTPLPEKGIRALYSQVDKIHDIKSKMGTADVAVLCIDASNVTTFEGKVNEFISEARGMHEKAAVVIVATNIDKLVKNTQDAHPLERYVDLFALQAGLTPTPSSEVVLNSNALQLHGYLKDLNPAQKEVMLAMTKNYVAGKLTRPDFLQNFSVKLAEFNNENNNQAVSELSQGNNSPKASKLKAVGQASSKLSVNPATIASLMRDIADSQTIKDEVKSYVDRKVDREVSRQIGEMAESVQHYITRSNEPDGKVKPEHKVTLVLSSIEDVGSARKVADDNRAILSGHGFENAGAADPMQVIHDQVRPSGPEAVEVARQSAVTNKSTRSALEPARRSLLDVLKQGFNISGSKIETAAAPMEATKNVDVAESPKNSRGLPQWATARPSHSQQEVQGQEKGKSKGAVQAAQSSRAAAESAQSSPVPPRKWAESKAKSSSAPDIRDSKQKEPAAGTSPPKMGK